MPNLTQPPDRLTVRTTQPRAGVAVLHIRGELDLLTAPLVDSNITKQLTDLPRTHLVLDLTDVTFFGSAGLATLVRGSDTAGERNVELILVITSRVVLRPLEVTGITNLFTIHDTLDKAMTYCG